MSLLPARRWDEHPDVPLLFGALVSGVLTFVLGVLLGVVAFFEHLYANSSNPTRILVVFTFLIATPKGWLSGYLMVSGAARAIASRLGDPAGDPLITLIDQRFRSARRQKRERDAAAIRSALEGPEVRDRVITPDQAGLADCDLVIVASRQKPGWEPGVVVITENGCYRVGQPAERTVAGHLRTLYPLQEDRTLDVIRRSVHYTLPD
jgi:hypothetical protein